MKITIKDVARQAGVSVATVSRVFNNSGPVSDETRRRIHTVAERLRYTPNGVARSLSTRRTGTVGVLLPDLWGEFFSEVIRGLDQTAQSRDYHLLLSSSHDNRGAVAAALQAMRGRVDGLIVMSPHIDVEILAANLPEGLPVVLLNSPAARGFDSLGIDNFGGAFAMVGHLAGHGHRRIAMIRGPEHNHDAGERLRGYRAALAAAGLEHAPELEARGDFTEESGHAAAEQLTALPERPTAIFAANDSMAIGALLALREAGLSIPRDVAIAGFDDIRTSRYLTPALSSVHVSIGELGAAAMERLLATVERGSAREPVQATLPTTLVLRESCGGHPGGASASAPEAPP